MGVRVVSLSAELNTLPHDPNSHSPLGSQRQPQKPYNPFAVNDPVRSSLPQLGIQPRAAARMAFMSAM